MFDSLFVVCILAVYCTLLRPMRCFRASLSFPVMLLIYVLYPFNANAVLSCAILSFPCIYLICVLYPFKTNALFSCATLFSSYIPYLYVVPF